jgi:uncharacterized membrane protein
MTPSQHPRGFKARDWALVTSSLGASAFIVLSLLSIRRLYEARCEYVSAGQLIASLVALMGFTALLALNVYNASLLRYRRKHGGTPPGSPGE